MSIHEDLDLAPLDRRAFLRVALGTLPAAALGGGALARLWPADEGGREVDEPYLLCKDGRSIWDPSDEMHCVEPTLRELLALGHDHRFGWAEGDELETLLEDLVAEEQGLDPEDDEDAAALEAGVARLRAGLDEPGDTTAWSAAYDTWLDVEGNRAAHSTWDGFPEDRLEAAGLYFVEGSCPGSNFYSVCYDGTVDELNASLARVGLNIVVEERAK